MWVSEPKPQQCFHQSLFEPPSWRHATLNIFAFPFLFLFRLAYTAEGRSKWGSCGPPVSLTADISLSKRPLANILAVTATIFGALHFITWSFQMPTTAELLLWQTASIALTAIPSSLLLFGWLKRRLSPGGESLINRRRIFIDITRLLEAFFFVMHPMIRLIVFVDALALLRSLPKTAFLDLNWAGAIPSF